MKTEGPALESLLHRLTETPEDFLAEPRIGGSGKINVAAVIGDCLIQLGISTPPIDIGVFQGTDRNRLSIGLLLAWLLSEPWFQEQRLGRADAIKALVETSAELAPHVAARKFVEDPDRREELARFALARLDMRPAGESVAQAQDRLTTISTAERSRVMRAARAAEERSRAIREELARKAAEESADKFTRE
jgi:hypothetical protein